MMVGKMSQERINEGWINDRTYPTCNLDENGVPRKSLGHTPVYMAWKNMKERCTSKKLKEKSPTYIGVDASVEFKNFTFFHDWWFEQKGNNFPNLHLDKDLLIKGNKIYSPKTCLLIPSFVNNFLVNRGADRGDYLIGVCKQGYYKNGDVRYMAGVSDYDPISGKTRREHIGCFRYELEAFRAYKEAKEAIAKKYAAYLQGKVDDRVINALLNFEVNITD
jgi:hypothetical protein